MMQKAWKIGRRKLAQSLEQIRSYSTRRRSDTKTRLTQKLEQYFSSHRDDASLEVVQLFQRRGVVGLEDAGPSGEHSARAEQEITITLPELEWLADGYSTKRVFSIRSSAVT